ncbi:hypothetical protein RND71_025537 [Anisodus tanguticus]|uniref:Uncharacterized protein n=1 Tax=Anisodus tanguticus TaxID=243964 RepID=A0AAE1RRJ8_9SOLA|nr:hypothetical protein RND71_025537 [Anisodus tanguticus]
MEEIASLWSNQETVDEMRHKLLYTNLELEQLKAEKTDEMRKNKEYMKQLIQLLNMVCQERDEARDQLEKLLNKLDSPNFVKVTKANSSTTESNSLHNSSPINSFFDTVSSPEFSNNNNNNMADSNEVAYMNQSLSHDCNVRFSDNYVPQVDKATLVIDNLVKGKTLPQQGKLLKAVIESGPLLQTLIVAGSLPQWRNPPQLKSFNIPTFSIKGRESNISNQNLCASLINPLRS